MNLNISVIQVEQTTVPTAKSSYQKLEVTYKNLDSGKVESKKIMSFAHAIAFKALAAAKNGDVFSVESEKNKDGYWDWLQVVQAAPGAIGAIAQANTQSAKVFVPTKSTYETPEERAKKQVYIVKQSSLTAALKFAELNKEKPTTEGLLTLAQEFTDWVFSSGSSQTTSESLLADMADDVPY